MKFIHAADIHLDSPLRGLEEYEGAPVEQIRSATRRALENLVELAIEERVDFLLIAGDLYDGSWKDYNTGLFFVRQMARLNDADIPVFLITGNHDAANKMTKSLSLDGLKNVFTFSTKKPQSHRLIDLGVVVHGRSYAKEAETDNLAAAYPVGEPGKFNIGLLHTSLDGREGHANYAPCTPEDLKSKGYQYWALGHVHTREDTLHTDPPIVFPGNIQGRHARETGPKGCVLVTVDELHHCELQFRELDVMRWERITVDCSSAETISEVLDLCVETFRELSDESEMLLAIRLTLTGATPAHQSMMADPTQLIADLRAAAITVGYERLWLEKIRIKTSPSGALDDFTATEGPLAELVRLLRELPGDDAALQQFVAEFAPLHKKLQPVLSEFDDLSTGSDELPDLSDSQYFVDLLSEVEQLLVKQLQAQEGNA